MSVASSIPALGTSLSTALPEREWWPEIGALHVLALALFLAVALAWGRHRSRRLVAASGLITTLLIILTYCSMVRPSDIPIDWITILHHGLGRKSIMHLYTRGVHAGPNFAFVLSLVGGEHSPTLYDVVWLNLLLALLNAAIFFHVAAYVAGPVWALVWTLVFALNPAIFLASFSELPTNLLALYFLAGVVAWAVLIDTRRQPIGVRAAAYTLCAVLTFILALTRFEVMLLGAVMLTVHAGYGLLGDERWSAAWRRLREACEPLLAFFDAHPAVVSALCVVGIVLSLSGIPRLVSRATVAGIYPFNPSILSLYVYLPMLLLPLGACIGLFFGFVHATRHFWRFGGLALSLLLLVRADFAAESQFYEMGRYLSYVLPAIFLLGPFGIQEFDGLTRRFSPNWGRFARIVFLTTWFTLPLPGIVALYARPEYDREGGFAQLLLDLNTQREVRYLMKLTETNTDCAFVARVINDYDTDPRVATQYEYVLFGSPVPHPIVAPENEVSLGDFIARYASDVSCVRLYAGGDCNLTFTDRCTNFIAGHRLVDEYRFWSRPYNNPLRSGYGAPEIVLATYAWP